jgi:hypothetical protein
MPADQATEPLGQRVDDARGGDTRWNDDQHPIATIFPETGSPVHSRPVEGALEDSVQFLPHKHADVIVAIRTGKFGDVNREQGTHLPASRRSKCIAGWMGHRVSLREAGPMAMVRPSATCLSAPKR